MYHSFIFKHNNVLKLPVIWHLCGWNHNVKAL